MFETFNSIAILYGINNTHGSACVAYMEAERQRRFSWDNDLWALKKTLYGQDGDPNTGRLQV